MEDQLYIGIDISEKDIAALTVARKDSNGKSLIMNVFFGDEAIELYKKLTTVSYKSSTEDERGYHEHSFRVNIR